MWYEKASADIMALFSWLQNRHKIRVVGGRPVERSMMSVTLVQSIKSSEVKGKYIPRRSADVLAVIHIPIPVLQI